MSDISQQLRSVRARISQDIEALDFLAKLIEARELRTIDCGGVLNVPYHSQHDADARGASLDCGPACIEMLIKFFDPDAQITTDSIMTHITGGRNRPTSVRELQSAFENFLPGYYLRRENDCAIDDLKRFVESVPVICLVHYGESKFRMDRQYTGGHWLVVVGQFHDPVAPVRVLVSVVPIPAG